MSDLKYVFDNSKDREELKRLEAIEGEFDPQTRERLLSTGVKAGWRCLEVGAGAGSIARWMSQRVQEEGKVVALDINPRYLQSAVPVNLEFVTTDIRTTDLKEDSFDLIHARYVLIHIPDYEVALQRMLALLKPGGWIVLEEPDFSVSKAVSGPPEDCRAVGNVYNALDATYSVMGLDWSVGIKLPAFLQARRLRNLTWEVNTHLNHGGTGIARIMRMSTEHLKHPYLDTGKATNQDIERYIRFTEDKNSWTIYYSTISVMAQK